jgi:hypothetical protein
MDIVVELNNTKLSGNGSSLSTNICRHHIGDNTRHTPLALIMAIGI